MVPLIGFFKEKAKKKSLSQIPGRAGYSRNEESRVAFEPPTSSVCRFDF
jgi:hypothetical protein